MWQTQTKDGRPVVVSDDLDDATVWEYAVNVGATMVVLTPDGDLWAEENLVPEWKAPR